MNRITATCPTRVEAETLLNWAAKLNPGPWEQHSKVVGRAADTIARACGMDAEIAYVLGLLHDIGRYEGVRDLHHIVAGYYFMQQNGYTANAQICLTHSFPIKDINSYSGKNFDCSCEEIELINDTLVKVEYDNYDRLIQLCDAICLPEGVCLLDVRLMDVARRHGFNDYTLAKWEAMFKLKVYFDCLCSQSIYKLFQDEVCANCIQ